MGTTVPIGSHSFLNEGGERDFYHEVWRTFDTALGHIPVYICCAGTADHCGPGSHPVNPGCMIDVPHLGRMQEDNSDHPRWH